MTNYLVVALDEIASFCNEHNVSVYKRDATISIYEIQGALIPVFPAVCAIQVCTFLTTALTFYFYFYKAYPSVHCFQVWSLTFCGSFLYLAAMCSLTTSTLFTSKTLAQLQHKSMT